LAAARAPLGRLEKILMGDKKKPESARGFDPGVAVEPAFPAKKRAPNIKDHISRQLRALYDEVANQPVPGRFLELLDRLDEKSKNE
jgi:hypothetical protein